RQEPTAGHFGTENNVGFELVTGDLSFISLTLVLPALAPLVRPGGHLLMLVKPQFELQPPQLGKGGIVRDASLFDAVEARIRAAAAAAGLRVAAWLPSPIAGGDGNREFFLHARR
ncbi:MAG TPA: TlyA family RNA methyltransferase, partial [Ottowia sp.]|nr:TlyA family RNA methyltransferase [Ottowia sp.]